MKFILGKKVNMTQIWENDKVIAITRVHAGPCFITQVKDDNSDSYKAVQLSYGEKKKKNISKPVSGHLKKAGMESARHLREFRVIEIKPEMKTGKLIDVSTFSKGDIIDITGTSKGKGFQGVVKRHGFSGSKKTHGNKDQLRASGSIGAKGPAHVFKGKKMAGRMGGDRVTIKNLEIIDIDIENNILFIKGAVPGCENGLLMIKGQGDLLIKDKNEKVEEVKKADAENKELKIEIAEDVVGGDGLNENKVEDGSNQTEKIKDDVKEEILENKTKEKTEEVVLVDNNLTKDNNTKEKLEKGTESDIKE